MSESLPQPGQDLDRSIYVMPTFVTFECADIDRTARWYVDGLGFFVVAQYPGLTHLRRWRYQDILLVDRQSDASTPSRGVRLTIAAGDEDLVARAERARGTGLGETKGPAATGWNTIDLACTDPDGHVVIFTALDRSRVPDPRFSESIRRGYEEARATERE